MTLFFNNDYSRGAHPKVIEKILETNMQVELGYGFDSYCSSAKDKIKKSCGKEDSEIYFLVGGTQTNATVIRSVLKQCEGVIAPDTGHISTHEAGIIEVGGHKVIELKNYEGKIRAIDVNNYIENYNKDEIKMHMVRPGMVYITYPTEYGTLYSKANNYKFFINSPTNQQFIILENEKIKKLQKFINFSIWENYDENNSVIRLVTDWSTTEEDINKVIKLF